MTKNGALSKRLNAALDEGGLSKRDLSIWFGRPYATVRMWIEGVQEPWVVWKDDIEQKLAALEHLIRQRKSLPIPPSFNHADRRGLIERLVRERDLKLPRARASG